VKIYAKEVKTYKKSKIKNPQSPYKIALFATFQKDGSLWQCHVIEWQWTLCYIKNVRRREVNL